MSEIAKTKDCTDMMTPAIDKLATALAKAQGEIGEIPKNKTVQVTMKSGGKYSFDYADLSAIRSAITKPLSDNGLSWIQLPIADGSRIGIITKILHSSGQQIEGNPLFANVAGDIQALGSTLTYLRRYGITIMLGIVADSDDDGNMADGNEAAISQKKRAGKVAPKTAPQKKPAPASGGKNLGQYKLEIKAHIDKIPTAEQQKEWMDKFRKCTLETAPALLKDVVALLAQGEVNPLDGVE